LVCFVRGPPGLGEHMRPIDKKVVDVLCVFVT
jgi:hypothetical protein